MSGPLAGFKIVEFEGLGPGPLAAMFLADFGAEVTVIRRRGGNAMARTLGGAGGPDVLARGKQGLVVDLKQPKGVALALDMVAQADALIEGNRPGVMERLGLGPEACLARNPRLIYGRMTGWGQSGPLAMAAGHDLNYVALTGLLGLGRGGDVPARPPATIVGDAIGALGLAFGIVAAAFEARSSGKGQVVDAAIIDIAAMLGSLAFWIHGGGQLGGKHPSPFYDAPFYDNYECADGHWITVAPLEPQFYALMLQLLGITDAPPVAQYDFSQWPAFKARLAALFKTQPRAHWCALLEGTDACFAPILDPREAAAHPHHVARGTFRVSGGTIEAMPAPRLSRTPAVAAPAPNSSGGGTAQGAPSTTPPLLAALGLAPERLAALRAAGVIG